MSVTRIAEGLGVCWHTPNSAILAEAQQVLDDSHPFDGVAIGQLSHHRSVGSGILICGVPEPTVLPQAVRLPRRATVSGVSNSGSPTVTCRPSSGETMLPGVVSNTHTSTTGDRPRASIAPGSQRIIS